MENDLLITSLAKCQIQFTRVSAKQSNWPDKDIPVIAYFFLPLRSAVLPSYIFVRNKTSFMVNKNKIVNKQMVMYAYLCYERPLAVLVFSKS